MAELGQGGFWQKGPKFLEEDISTWPIRKDFRTDKLEGEITPKSVHIVLNVSIEVEDALNALLSKFSNSKKLFRIGGYIFKWRSIYGKVDSSVANVLTPECLKRAKIMWIRLAQLGLQDNLEAAHG